MPERTGIRIKVVLSDNVAPSKWVQVVERIERQADSLGAYAEELSKDRREFRQGFHFRHDEPPPGHKCPGYKKEAG